MSASSLAKPLRRRIAWATLPAKTRAAFARLRERCGFAHNSAWAFSLQPEHLLAYVTWGESLSDSDDDARDMQPDQWP